MHKNSKLTTGGRLALRLGTLHNGGAGDDIERRDVWRRLAGDSVWDENNSRWAGCKYNPREARSCSVRGRITTQWNSMLDMLPDRYNNNIRVRHRIQTVSKWENIKYLASICRRFRRGIPGARLNAAGVPA